MSMERTMELVNRLLAQAQALGAVSAHLQLAATGASADPALRPHLDRVIDLLGARADLDALTDEERGIVVGFATSYLRQALELMENPGRPGAWSHRDPVVLQAQGAASGVVARLCVAAKLVAPGARILDIGTGVAGLAIAFCHTVPGATVVGIDPWEPSLALARRNISEAGLDQRITLRSTVVEEFEDDKGFDLIWFPSFFIPETALDAGFRRARGLLRPDGRLVVGVVTSGDDPMEGALDDLITVRSGGSVLSPEEAIERLRAAGYASAREVDRTWKAPLRLVVGQ